MGHGGKKMNTNIQTNVQKEDASKESVIDEKMRAFLKSAFRDSTWFSSLPTLRELFAAIFDRYGDRISKGREKGSLPTLDDAAVRRELMYLANLEVPIATIQGRTMTFWELYLDATSILEKRIPQVSELPSKNIASLRYRIAQYAHIIRNARKATD